MRLIQIYQFFLVMSPMTSHVTFVRGKMRKPTEPCHQNTPHHWSQATSSSNLKTQKQKTQKPQTVQSSKTQCRHKVLQAVGNFFKQDTEVEHGDGDVGCKGGGKNAKIISRSNIPEASCYY